MLTNAGRMRLLNCQAVSATSGANMSSASISFQLMMLMKISAPTKLSALSNTVISPDEIRLRTPSISPVMRDMISPMR